LPNHYNEGVKNQPQQKGTTMTHTRLKTEIITATGNSKTVCVTAVLTALGIDADSFKFTWNERTRENVWAGILRRNGFAVRSRKSQMPRRATVGSCREAIAKLNDPTGTLYVVGVACHVLLLNAEGKTVVDTAPRKRDRRTVTRVCAVFPK